MKSPGLGQPLQCSLAFQGLEMRGAGVARRPKIGTEISISASSSIGTESSKSASNSTIRSPDPQAVLTQAIRKTFPDLCPRFEKMSMESRKDGKAAKTALHVCARVIVPAIKKTRAGYALGVYKSLPQLAGSFGAAVGVSGEGGRRPGLHFKRPSNTK
jgi:hypothetical protein